MVIVPLKLDMIVLKTYPSKWRSFVVSHPSFWGQYGIMVYPDNSARVWSLCLQRRGHGAAIVFLFSAKDWEIQWLKLSLWLKFSPRGEVAIVARKVTNHFALCT